MPGGAGKAKRGCRMCRPYKVAGNGKERKLISELRRTGETTRRVAKKVDVDE